MDSSKAAIPGATVTVENEGTGAQRHVVTDSSGIYVAAELPVGYYSVRFKSPGLGNSERQGVKVDVGGETRVDVMLSPQAIEQSVDRYVWVTPFKENENFAAGDFPNQSLADEGLSTWVEADRSIDDTDVVLWYAFGHTRIPRPED